MYLGHRTVQSCRLIWRGSGKWDRAGWTRLQRGFMTPFVPKFFSCVAESVLSCKHIRQHSCLPDTVGVERLAEWQYHVCRLVERWLWWRWSRGHSEQKVHTGDGCSSWGLGWGGSVVWGEWALTMQRSSSWLERYNGHGGVGNRWSWLDLERWISHMICVDRRDRGRKERRRGMASILLLSLCMPGLGILYYFCIMIDLLEILLWRDNFVSFY